MSDETFKVSVNKYDHHSRSQGYCMIVDSKGQMVANTGSAHKTKEENEQFAAFITHAANCHAELLEVAKIAESALRGRQETPERAERYKKVVDIISKAETEQKVSM